MYCSVFNKDVAGEDDLVPFVIPARTNTASLIAFNYQPLSARSRLITHKDGHFYNQDGQRVRLWGVNLSFNANFPTHKDADEIAERMARAGINAVRCHHMDTSRWPRGIWDKQTGTHLEPLALDRLDYFINQLAMRGIYIDLNLHVGRDHSEYLRLPKTGIKNDKMVDIFTPALIQAQKDYARELLNHVNKYRHIRYGDDPAIAIVEISNEDSLFMWSAPRSLPGLPPYYADILQNKFNQWLKKYYGTTRKLRQVWCPSGIILSSNVLHNTDFSNLLSKRNYLPSPWMLEQHNQCQAQLSRVQYQNISCLQIKPLKTDGTDWHLQLNQRNVHLKAGQIYTVEFRGSAKAARSLMINAGQGHLPWSSLGLNRKVNLGNKWQIYRLIFTCRKSDDNARLNFAFGNSNIAIYITDIKLMSGAEYKLENNTSLENGTIKLFGNGESPRRKLDRMCFLAETERAFYSGMKNYIKNDLHCQALITGTIVFGPLGLYAQSDMDFIDGHAYWQHPRFPGRPWDSANWYIKQMPMVDNISLSPLFNLEAERLAGKPFTITEYNHPAPQDSQASCVPIIACFGAAQDYDGIWLYTYSQSNKHWERKAFTSYFDIANNSAKWGLIPAGAIIFRQQGIEPLANWQKWSLANTADMLADMTRWHIKYGRNMFFAMSDVCNLSRSELFQKRMMITLDKLPSDTSLVDSHTKLRWIINKQHHGIYYASSSRVWIATGHADMFHNATNGKISVTKPDYATITVTAMDNASLVQSRKILITACGRCENTDMKFSPDRSTVGTHWGHDPVCIEPVQAVLHIPGNKISKAVSLSPNGAIKATDIKVHQNTITISGKYKTMWYILTR